MSETSSTLAERLENEIANCQWADLKDHVARGAVILIAPRLTLLDAAMAVAQDQTDRVTEWLQEGLISKPTQVQAERYEASPDTVFRFVIVQPLVLVKVRTD